MLRMKSKFIIFFFLLFIFSFKANAQNQTISMQPSYAHQIFYSMENGEIANIDNTDWDLAFSTGAMSSSIRINGGMGTELYLYPLGDTTNWNTFNSSNISSWSPVHNSDTNWQIGAFDKHSTSLFDMGWGIYNIATHYVYGDSIYAIKTINGNWKKLWIQQLAQGEYNFKYANLDGTGEVDASIQQSNFANRNFAYYSLDQNTSINREPNSQDWDITFTKYITPVQGMPYGVTGVLSNIGIKVAQADNLPSPNSYDDYMQHQMMSEMNAIGYDWKEFDMSTMSYSTNTNRCYFIKDFNEKIWRVVFTSFEGSSTGIVEFHTEEITNSTFISESKSDISTFEIYPNPITENNLTVIYDNTTEKTELYIYDITGKKMHSEMLYGSGFQAQLITIPHLNKGAYIAEITSKGSTFQKKIIVK